MRGIILAGGTGSRMYPCTKVTNKHLLPVYNKPMIYYPIQTLVDAGIKEILIVSGKGRCGDFLNLLGSGKEFGVTLTYEIQEEAGGIAQALQIGKRFAGNESIIVLLGDNIFEDNIKGYVQEFKKQGDGARIFVKEVSWEEAKRFGLANIQGDKVIEFEEKPQTPKSNLAITGLYMFDQGVFKFIDSLEPSARGELEITDAIDHYVKNGRCYCSKITGFWLDAGTFESMLEAGKIIKEKEETKPTS